MVILIKYLTALCFHFPISIEYCQLLKAKIYFPDLHLCNSGEVNITDHILCRGVSLVQNPEVGFLSQRHVHPKFLQVQPRHAPQLCWLTFPHTHVLLVLVVLFSAFLFFSFFLRLTEKNSVSLVFAYYEGSGASSALNLLFICFGHFSLGGVPFNRSPFIQNIDPI